MKKVISFLLALTLLTSMTPVGHGEGQPAEPKLETAVVQANGIPAILCFLKQGDKVVVTKELDEKYPVVAARVRSQLENGWEPTMALLEQAVAEGVMRPVSLPVLRQMITASIESFLADRSLAESGVHYVAVLEEMISILLEGVLPR